ncbi:hypothetical protein [Bradyrhizobium monzae]|uniref:hypothetical protein n=1 Tax=Bradyrhizobium sp. Oc8 TaxID=2876780 RepID=UPI001F415DA8|nr:hypothetical protein [Bradyrhizobium sp. Oc8]
MLEPTDQRRGQKKSKSALKENTLLDMLVIVLQSGEKGRQGAVGANSQEKGNRGSATKVVARAHCIASYRPEDCN